MVDNQANTASELDKPQRPRALWLVQHSWAFVFIPVLLAVVLLFGLSRPALTSRLPSWFDRVVNIAPLVVQFTPMLLIVIWVQRLRRRVLACDGFACPNCVYDLRGLEPEAACPECGYHSIDKGLPELWRQPLGLTTPGQRAIAERKLAFSKPHRDRLFAVLLVSILLLAFAPSAWAWFQQSPEEMGQGLWFFKITLVFITAALALVGALVTAAMLFADFTFRRQFSKPTLPSPDASNHDPPAPSTLQP